MYKPGVSAILKSAAEFESVDESIEYLKRFDSHALRSILYLMWSPNIKFHKDLPEGTTPYTPSKFDEPGRLPSEIRRMYLFIEGGKNAAGEEPNITPVKRQMLWVQMLESMSPDDAVLLDHIKDRKTPYKRISRHLTKKAFPGLIEE